jgi:glyoxylase-like metal-dependent hydrolase (beta-lactamase superfamily II)
LTRVGRLEIVQIPAGPLETNAYLVVDAESGEALLVDAPPDSFDAITAEASQRGVAPALLVVTHGHWDHIVDVVPARDHFSATVLAHDGDRELFENPVVEEMTAFSPDQALRDGDTVQVGGVTFQVLHTPGHSPGQISLYSEADAVLLGGDTLFPGGYGTVEVPGASTEQTVETMCRLAQLPDEVRVFPGHGSSTTIGSERSWMERVADTGRLL